MQLITAKSGTAVTVQCSSNGAYC